MPQDLTDDMATLVQVMAWCCQATSYYLNQCSPRYPIPNGISTPQWVNSLVTGRCRCNFKNVFSSSFNVMISRAILCEADLRRVPQDPIDYKSKLVQVMAWCHQAPSHYLNQCWTRSLMQCDVTRPQWVTIFFVWHWGNRLIVLMPVNWHWFGQYVIML